MNMHLKNIRNPKFKLIEGGYIPTSCFAIKTSRYDISENTYSGVNVRKIFDFLRSKKKVKILNLSDSKFSIRLSSKKRWWVSYPNSFWRDTPYRKNKLCILRNLQQIPTHPIALGDYSVKINKKYKLVKIGCYVINLATFDKALKEVSELIKNKRLRKARLLETTSALSYCPAGFFHFPCIMHNRSCSYYNYSDAVKFRKDLKNFYSI